MIKSMIAMNKNNMHKQKIKLLNLHFIRKMINLKIEQNDLNKLCITTIFFIKIYYHNRKIIYQYNIYKLFLKLI